MLLQFCKNWSIFCSIVEAFGSVEIQKAVMIVPFEPQLGGKGQFRNLGDCKFIIGKITYTYGIAANYKTD